MNNVSVNVYSCGDKNQIYPLHVNKEKSDHFDLFFSQMYHHIIVL